LLKKAFSSPCLFFPRAGATESCNEAKRLYQIAGAEERFDKAQAPEKHGLTLPLRQATWFDRWLAKRQSRTRELRKLSEPVRHVGQVEQPFTKEPQVLLDWIKAVMWPSFSN